MGKKYEYERGEFDGISRIFVAEFNALRREIEINIEHQKEIMNFSILTLTAMAGLFGFIKTENIPPSFSNVFLIFPWVFILLTLLYADKTIRILRVADYLHNYLRKKIISICRNDFWQWELYKTHESSFKRELAMGLDRTRWGIFVMPTFLSLVFYCFFLEDICVSDVVYLLLYAFFLLAVVIIIAKRIIFPLEETEPIEDRPTMDLTVSMRDNVIRAATQTIVNNFSNLSEDVLEKILLNLSENSESSTIIATIIAQNFANLMKENQKNVRERVLLNLSKKNRAALVVANIVEKNFGDLSPNVRERVLLNLSKKNKTLWAKMINFIKRLLRMRK
jgi:hypothetical protein